MKLSQIVSLSETFQNSVNIDFDLGKPEKIDEYIPTSDICDVLNVFFTSFSSHRSKSTFLIGPYGKGKSFLILVLLQVIGGIASKEEVARLCERIRPVSSVLADQIESYQKSGAKYLPVVVNSQYDNLKQSFLVALRDSLVEHGLGGLVPQSSYSVCLDILHKWTKDPAISQGRLRTCASDLKLNLVELESGLSSYSPDAYKKFEALYNCVSIGQRFNPLVAEDTAGLYAGVAAKLKETGKFDGIFVVFDEFSKFLETGSRSLSDDLKFIQDFAEKVERSDSHYSLHLCCIAHKPITQYAEKGSKVGDTLRTVEGRFDSIRFNREMKQYLELISNAIIKKPGFDQAFNHYRRNHENLLKTMVSLPAFQGDPKAIETFKSCYPLNPLMAYLLVKVSEIVAQNERTLFTFISGDDASGLRHFLEKDSEETMDASYIYDYFYEQFKEDPSEKTRNIWYLSDAAIRDATDLNEIKIIKTLAVVLTIDDPAMIPSDQKTLALAIGFLPEDLDKTFARLSSGGIVKKNLFDGQYSFAFVGSKEINEAADALLAGELRKTKFTDALNVLEKDRYYLPNAYNAQNRIVRFYRYVYVPYQEFLKVQAFSEYKSDGDGCLLRLLGEGIDLNAVRAKVEKVKDPQVVVEVGSSDSLESLERLSLLSEAYRFMSTSANESFETVNAISAECSDEIESILKKMFGSDQVQQFYWTSLKAATPSLRLSEVFSLAFAKGPVINNEMINRAKVNPQYAKARDVVVDFLLSGKSMEKEWHESETSPQSTVKKVFIDASEDPSSRIKPILDLTKKVIGQATDRKYRLKELVDTLVQPPYGVRSGVLPLFVGKAIADLSSFDDSAVALYFNNHEAALDSAILSKALSGNDGYLIQLRPGTVEKSNYLKSVLTLFGGIPAKTARENTYLVLETMRNWARNLPQITRTATVLAYPTAINTKDERFLHELLKFDLNPTDTVFDFQFTLFETRDYDNLYAAIKAEKKRLEDAARSILKEISIEINTLFGFNKGSLQANMKTWIAANSYSDKTILNNPKFQDLARQVAHGSLFDDETFIATLSRYLVSVSVEDWAARTNDDFMDSLKKWKAQIEASSDPVVIKRNATISALTKTVTAEHVQLSPVSPLLENQIEAQIASFGTSITNTDIIMILTDIINKHSK